MSYEWRIFYTDASFIPWNPEKKEKRDLLVWISSAHMQKERRDYYYDLRDFTLGLKERWTGKIHAKNLPLLELKVREKKEGEVERWVKCLRRRIETPLDERQGLDADSILSHLRDELENPRPKSQGFLKEIEKVIVCFEEDLPARIRVGKARRQVKLLYSRSIGRWSLVVDEGDYRNLVHVEQTDFEITRKAGDQPFQCRTVCVEGKDLALVEQFRDSFILRGSGLVAGYPEFLSDIHRP